MTALTLKNLPPKLLRSLRAAAENDRRSLNQEIFGSIKALFERQGQRPDDADLLIGAIAISQGAAVVTGNLRHYERIPGIDVENWIRR